MRKNVIDVLDICQAGFNITKREFLQNKHKYLTWTGLILWGVATVSACVTTSEKLPQIVDYHEYAMDNAYEKPTEKEVKKEVAITWRDTVIDCVKAYAIPTACAIGGTICILSSDKIQEDFTNDLLKECAALKFGWDAYRDRVRNRYGEQAEYDIYNDIQRGKVIEETTDAKGKKKTEEKDVILSSNPGRFSFLFGRDTANDNYYPNDPEHNRIFVDHVTQMINSMIYNKRYMGTMNAETILKMYGIDVDTEIQNGSIGADEAEFFGIINDGKSRLEVKYSPDFGTTNDETYLEFNFVDLRKPIIDYQKMLEERCEHARMMNKFEHDKIYEF